MDTPAGCSPYLRGQGARASGDQPKSQLKQRSFRKIWRYGEHQSQRLLKASGSGLQLLVRWSGSVETWGGSADGGSRCVLLRRLWVLWVAGSSWMPPNPPVTSLRKRRSTTDKQRAGHAPVGARVSIMCLGEPGLALVLGRVSQEQCLALGGSESLEAAEYKKRYLRLIGLGS